MSHRTQPLAGVKPRWVSKGRPQLMPLFRLRRHEPCTLHSLPRRAARPAAAAGRHSSPHRKPVGRPHTGWPAMSLADPRLDALASWMP